MNIKRTSLLIALLFIGSVAVSPTPVTASTSPNYQIIEDDVGSGGRTESSSAGYTAQDSLGNTTVGDSAGTLFRQQTGPVTTNDPSLTVIVDTPSVNLGALSTSATKTGAATFRVLNYTSYGYVVQIVGAPPSNGTHTLTGMGTAGPSQTGSEQFGINIKDNSSPDVGAEAQQVPDGTFSFGAAAAGYNTANSFKYVSGNTIAQAVKSSGRTDYTISFIANISINTPGGSYSGNQTLVVTGTY
ncbi:MAG TPA: hypothetical protein VFB59_02295 [Candidatus Saccharimonadales bacterium]|nr:hypothetical protein [Candidatus Saccharimonadales bacterium]